MRLSAMTKDAIGAGMALEYAARQGLREIDGPHARAYISGLSLSIRQRLHAGETQESIWADLLAGEVTP